MNEKAAWARGRMKILVVKLSSLGDLFNALPAVRRIKRGTGASIDWVVQDEYKDLVGCFPDVDRALVFPRDSFSKGAVGFAERLRETEYDVVVDMQGLFKSGLVCLMAKARRKIGPADARECASMFYTERSRTTARSAAVHAVDRNLRIAERLVEGGGAPEFPVRFPALDEGCVPDVRLLDPSLKKVALAPVSRWPTKTWPLERFKELVARLSVNDGIIFPIVGSAKERDVCESVQRESGGKAINLAGKLALPLVGAVLARADLLISNDSGPMHMAVAAGTRVLALLGPTDPARTGPYGLGHRVIAAQEECRPCFSRRCRFGGRADGRVRCMESISVEEVAGNAMEMLSQTGG